MLISLYAIEKHKSISRPNKINYILTLYDNTYSTQFLYIIYIYNI